MDSAAGPLVISIQQSLLPKTALVSSCFVQAHFNNSNSNNNNNIQNTFQLIMS